MHGLCSFLLSSPPDHLHLLTLLRHLSCSTFPASGTTDTSTQSLTANGNLQTATPATVSGLNPSVTTTYCYRICASATGSGYALQCDGTQTFTITRTGTTPAVTTLPANAVSSTGATLQGSVTDYTVGATVATRFQWGPCATFPASGAVYTTAQNVAMGANPTAIPGSAVTTPTTGGVSYCFKACSSVSGSSEICNGIQVRRPLTYLTRP